MLHEELVQLMKWKQTVSRRRILSMCSKLSVSKLSPTLFREENFSHNFRTWSK